MYGFQFRRHVAEEIEEQPLAVEQMLDVDEHGRDCHFWPAAPHSRVRFLAIFFQPGLEQLVLDRHAAKQVAVGKRAAVVAIFGRRSTSPISSPRRVRTITRLRRG